MRERERKRDLETERDRDRNRRRRRERVRERDIETKREREDRQKERETERERERERERQTDRKKVREIEGIYNSFELKVNTEHLIIEVEGYSLYHYLKCAALLHPMHLSRSDISDSSM